MYNVNIFSFFALKPMIAKFIVFYIHVHMYISNTLVKSAAQWMPVLGCFRNRVKIDILSALWLQKKATQINNYMNICIIINNILWCIHMYKFFNEKMLDIFFFIIVDQYDKLSPFGIYISGCIDGYVNIKVWNLLIIVI